jgi:hypothetical protein
MRSNDPIFKKRRASPLLVVLAMLLVNMMSGVFATPFPGRGLEG